MNFYHKAISLAGFVLLTVLPAQAQVRQTREEYINKYKKIAVAHMERYGIPASITMAQGILESDCGNSWVSQASNNHFGVEDAPHIPMDSTPSSSFRSIASGRSI